MVQVVINYWAVIVCAIVNMALGFYWYGPLFGRQWVALMGWSKEEVEKGQIKMQKEGWKTYLLAFAGSLIMACVLAHVLVFSSTYLGISGLIAGLDVGFFAWLGLSATTMSLDYIFTSKSKPWTLFIISSGCQLVTLVVISAILFLFNK